MDNASDVLSVSHLESSILHIQLNRIAAMNALNAELLQALQSCLLTAKEDPSVKAILLSGSGKTFCAGADIHQLASLNAQTGVAFARFGQAIFRMLEQLGKPSLAAIHGYALGGGCELAMSTTLRIAADTAQFAQPEIKLGVIPGFGGTQRLARLVGKGRALEACLTGRMIKAKEAHEWGLVNEVVSADQLIPRAVELLKQLVLLPPCALQSIMTVIDQGYDLSLPDACELEASHFGLCCATEDKQAGVSAFLEKRTATFVGK